ncbi:hypothetical protein [Algoriphagus namhaensis]
MNTLPKNWITRGTIDFEYKKYELLAYLKASGQSFKSLKLYPPLADLVDHHRLLQELEEGRESVSSLFPKRISHLDIQSAKIKYESTIPEDKVMKEIRQIAEFAKPRIRSKIEEGVEIFEFVKGQLAFEPVGILPIYKNEGYVLLTREDQQEIHAFRYKSSLIEYAGDRFRSISIWLIDTFRKSLAQTLEQIKLRLIKEIKDLPNPATWRIHSEQDFPIHETLVPISKRLLLNAVSRDET